MASILILMILEFFFALFLILGYLIKYRRRLDMIAVYREGRVKDPYGFSQVVGGSLLFLGIFAAVTLTFVILAPGKEVILFLLYTALVVPVTGVVTVLMSRRYLKT